MADADLTAILRLRRLWDARATGRPSPGAADAEQAGLIDRLHALDAAATGLDADPHFVQRLEDQLMSPPLPAGRPVELPQVHQGAPTLPSRLRLRASALSAVSVAALLTLILASALIIFHHPAPGRPGNLPAVWIAHDIRMDTPSPDECRIEPEAIEYVQVRGTPSSATIIPLATPGGREATHDIRMIDLPVGEAADPEIVAAVTATMREFSACTNAGDSARLAALHTNDFWRRRALMFETRGFEVEWDSEFGPPTPVGPEERWPAFFVADVRHLPDGRVSALVTHPYENVGAPYSARAGLLDPVALIVFSLVGDRWLIDERGEIVDAEAAALTYAGSDGAAPPTELSVTAGRTILLFIRNDDTGAIDLTVGQGESPLQTVLVPPQAVATLALANLEPGTYPATALVDRDGSSSRLGTIRVSAAPDTEVSQMIRLLVQEVQPARIEVPVNVQLTFVIENHDRVTMAFSIPTLDIEAQIEPNEAQTVSFTAAPGTHRFFSRPTETPCTETIGEIVAR